MTTEEKLIWVNSLKVGDVVCDCRFKHLKIAEIDGKGYDCQIVLEDGACCSAFHCCDRADHECEHPKGY